MVSREIRVPNRLGLHARAAARFVHAATAFQCDITVACGTRHMDGKSIMGILLLAAPCGSTLTISAHGLDEQAAIQALCQLVASGFGEEGWNG